MDLFQETALSGSQFMPPALPEVSDYGLPSLQRIFLKSHYNDPHLPAHIRDVIGVSIDSLEQQFSAMTPKQRIAVKKDMP